MRRIVVKKIRKIIYGDKSPRPDGRYYTRLPSGQIVAPTDRRRYQSAKRVYKKFGPEVMP